MNGRLFASAGSILLALLVSPSIAGEINGFLKSPGQGDVALSFTTEQYDRFWVGNSKTSDPGLGEIKTKSLSAWVGWGLTPDVSLFATLPYVDTHAEGPADLDESGLQDATVLVARRLMSRQATASHELVGAVGLRTPVANYPANRPVALGDGSSDALLRLTYLLRFRACYGSVQLGADLRDAVPDGYPVATELGLTRGRLTYSLGYTQLITPHGTDIGEPGFTFQGLREEYERIEGKLYLRTGSRFGLALSAFETLGGRNTGDSQGVSLGGVASF